LSKKEISKIFGKLRSFGFKVQNFNTPSRMNIGQKDWVDHVIYNKRYLIFVEVKLGKDKLSEGQVTTANYLSSIMALNKTVHYFIISSVKEAETLFDMILGKSL